MPELKRTFSGGIMNKDLDERLVPNGQYRDALNVQVSTSEGSDVGALQNILGNRVPYSQALSSTQLGPNAYVVGSIRKDDTECIYWFIASNTKSIILEYNQTSNVVRPILVDTQNILRFRRSNLITGVEILDDFLIWTDNQTEPKMIKISTWKGYANNSYNHTQVNINGLVSDFEEEQITVIKRGPKKPPKLKMSNTFRNGNIETSLANKHFAFANDGDFDPIPTGLYTDQNGDGNVDTASGEVNFATAAAFIAGDKLRLTVLDESDDEEVILSVVTAFTSDPTKYVVSVDSVSEDIQEGGLDWKVELIQDPPLFETKFPRFAYRYKYEDGEYSVISPFSQIAFIADDFDYVPKKGYNLGMVNNLRLLQICDWAKDVPDFVKEIDILYKDSVNSNIYVVKSVKTTDPEYSVTTTESYKGELEITSEIIYKTIPSNQILRPYDNVPRKAKALAVSGNRLMFGNYIENYNLAKEGNEITPQFTTVISQNPNLQTEPGSPGKSLKSLRTYQIGVVYRDKYGRETPVFTDPTGSISLDQSTAKRYNVLTANITSPIPTWADSYKFYIKETSQPYYNLAMDKHYPAEDGNVWIAFPSSERNKIQEESFMILKKKHDNDEPVEDDSKYKIIAIENEAPDFLKEKKVSKGLMSRTLIGSGDGNIFATQTGYPRPDGSFIEIFKGDWRKVYGGGDDGGTSSNTFAAAIPVHQLSDLTFRVSNGSNITKHYEIANIQYLPENNPSVYRVNLEERFDESDIGFVPAYNTDDTSLQLEIFQKTIKRKPEFQGRFFAKIQRDSTLDDAILSRANEEDYKIVAMQNIYAMPQGQNAHRNFWRDQQKGEYADGTGGGRGAEWFLCRNKYRYNPKDAGGNMNRGGRVRGFYSSTSQARNIKGFGAQAGNDYMEIAYHWFGPKDRKAWTSIWETFETKHKKQFREFVNALQRSGTKFRFTDDPNKEENTYTVEKFRRTHQVAFKKKWVKKGKWASSRIIKWTLQLDKPLVWVPEDNGHVSKATATQIEILQQYLDDDTLDGYESNNPAIWETEPKEVAELDIFYEASEAYDKSTHGTAQQLDYCNCYSFANGVESDRIRDDFNAPTIGKGVKASAVLEEQYEEVHKKSDIIFSGIYNSTSGINNINQFIQAEPITKRINPAFGSIQLLKFRRGALDCFLEDNVVKILSDKDALFNADGSANVVATNRVLGTIMPYAGDFGISKNPESYARYGNRAYFSDRNRGVVLRLSGDGLEPISRYGLEDFFRDKLATAQRVQGMFDENKKEYILSFSNDQKVATYNDTVSFKEDLNGWNTRKSYIAENGISLNNIFYTFSGGNLWSHDNEVRNNFYGVQYNSKVKFIFNDAPGTVKSFKTINYEGSQARIFKETGVGAITTFVAGTGYDTDTGIATTYSGSGTGATVDIITNPATNGVITAVTINTQGSGYTDGDVLTIVGGDNNATITIRVDGDSEFYNRNAVPGWWLNEMTSDLQEGIITRFKNKEGKWYNNIRGLELTDNNLDVREFSVQGLGFASSFAEANENASVLITIQENND